MAKSAAARKSTARKKAATGKSANKKSTAKKTSTKKTAVRKPAARKKTSVKKTTAKKPAPRSSAAGKTNATVSGKAATSKKSATRKTAGTKSSVRKKTASAKSRTADKTRGQRTKAGRPAPSNSRSAVAGASAATVAVPSSPAEARPQQKTQLDQAMFARIRAALEEELAELRRQQREIEQGTQELSGADVAGEIGLDEDFADAGTATFDRERDLSIRNNVLDLIDQTTRALERIDEGTYGYCERCGRPIPRERLEALPRTRMCMDCKRREERAR